MSVRPFFQKLAIAVGIVCGLIGARQASAQLIEEYPIQASLSDTSPMQESPTADAGGDICYECAACGPRFSMFGEYLLLRARDAEVAYAVPIDGPIIGPPTVGNGVQIGPTGVVDFDFQDAFRVGGEFYLDNCRSVRGTYTQFETDTSNAITIAPPDVIRSLVTHPQGTNAAFDGLDAAAQFAIDYQTIDVDFIWMHDNCECNYAYGLLLGARYGRLEQNFRSQIATNNLTFVNTNVDFEGAGVRVGAMGDWYACNRNLLLYFRSNLTMMAGEATGDYLQGDNVDPVQVRTSWQAGRLVSVVDLEMGLGWESCNGRVRASVGYVLSAWLNMVQTDEYITAVQLNQYNQGFDNLGDMMSFDGMTARVEVGF